MSLDGIIRLTGKNKDYRTGSARDLWWHELQKWGGKHVSEWAAAMSAQPPSKPAAGQYKDVGEPPSGWLSFFKREQLVTVDNGSQEGWTNEELASAVNAYVDILSRTSAGEKVVKARYYKDLADRFDRSAKAFEYRMQNISCVLADMGLDWIIGLPPAKNVGTNISRRIANIIRANKYFDDQVRAPSSSLVFLRKRALEIRARGPIQKPVGNKHPKRTRSTSELIERDPSVVAWVLDSADGACECCGDDAPFVRASDGTPYLEVHHVRTLAEGGSDTPENAVAVCPNCHRELHHGIRNQRLLNNLYERNERLIRE